MIQVQFRKCEGSLCIGEVLTTNSVGVSVRFLFSEEWEGLTKLCVFRVGTQRVDVLLEGDRCRIPPELLRQPDRRLFVGVRGTDEEGELILASTYVNLGVIQEGTFPSGVEQESYTPALVDQVLAAAGRAALQAVEQRLQERGLDVLLAAATVWGTEEGNPAVLRDAASGIPARAFSLETGFCSEGFDRLVFRRTGKNIWNSERFLEASSWVRTEDGGYTGRSSKLRAKFQDSAGGLFGNNLGWEEQVTISFEARTEYESGNRLTVYIAYMDGTSSTVSDTVNGTARTRYTLTSRAGKAIRSIFFSYGSDCTLWLYDFQVEFAPAATAYEPYSESGVTVSLPETVYGGALDLAAGQFLERYDGEGENLTAPIALDVGAAPPAMPLGDSVFFSELGSFRIEYCKNVERALARLAGE